MEGNQKQNASNGIAQGSNLVGKVSTYFGIDENSERMSQWKHRFLMETESWTSGGQERKLLKLQSSAMDHLENTLSPHQQLSSQAMDIGQMSAYGEPGVIQHSSSFSHVTSNLSMNAEPSQVLSRSADVNFSGMNYLSDQEDELPVSRISCPSDDSCSCANETPDDDDSDASRRDIGNIVTAKRPGRLYSFNSTQSEECLTYQNCSDIVTVWNGQVFGDIAVSPSLPSFPIDRSSDEKHEPTSLTNVLPSHRHTTHVVLTDHDLKSNECEEKRSEDSEGKMKASHSLQLIACAGFDADNEECHRNHQQEESLTRLSAVVPFGEEPVTESESSSRQSIVEPTVQPAEKTENEGFLYRVQAYQQYQKLVQQELEERKHIAQAKIARRAQLAMKLRMREKQIDNALTVALDHYGRPLAHCGSMKQRKGPRKRREHTSSSVEVRRQLEELPEYRPWFTCCISALQLITVIIVCAVGGFAKIGMAPVETETDWLSTLEGSDKLLYYPSVNPWFGPPITFLVSVGALYPPCMRDDIHTNIALAQLSEDNPANLGCCEVAAHQVAATTTQDECQELSNGFGVWTAESVCSERAAGNNSVSHEIRPCCLGMGVQCHLTTALHCSYVGGHYQPDSEHCSQVNCLSAVCGLDGVASRDLVAPRQCWRFLSSILLHGGLSVTVLVLSVQLVVARHIERLAGAIRLAIIYFLCAVGGNVVAALFSPDVAQLGAGGAMFGMLAVVWQELFQTWNLIDRPWFEVVKLTSVMLLFITEGTLPYVDNIAHVAGFVIGGICSVIFLPYITLSRWDAVLKRTLVVCAIPTLLAVLVLAFVVFYEVQMSVCPVCAAINCAPYMTNMCNASVAHGRYTVQRGYLSNATQHV